MARWSRCLLEIQRTERGMAILGFLQNAWFKDPVGAQKIFDRYPERRNELIARFLFAGCLTGRNLRKALGEDLCETIIWEETSPKIGGYSSARFPPEPEH